MTVTVSQHAIDRYIERVAAVSREAAHIAIMSHDAALNCADRLGGATVRLHDGTRLIVRDGCVKTVLGADCRFNHPRKAA